MFIARTVDPTENVQIKGLANPSKPDQQRFILTCQQLKNGCRSSNYKIQNEPSSLCLRRSTLQYGNQTVLWIFVETLTGKTTKDRGRCNRQRLGERRLIRTLLKTFTYYWAFLNSNVSSELGISLQMADL